jgi:hypothetical protein
MMNRNLSDLSLSFSVTTPATTTITPATTNGHSCEEKHVGVLQQPLLPPQQPINTTTKQQPLLPKLQPLQLTIP